MLRIKSGLTYEGVKGYKFWCVEAGFKRCLVSRDVVFNEIEMAYKTKPNMVQSNTDQSKETDFEKLNFLVETEDKHVETQAVNWPLDEEKSEEEEQEEADYVLA